MELGGKTPKSALHEFFQLQVRGGIPQFEIVDGAPPPALPNFTCKLTIPSLSQFVDGRDTQTVFTAEARTKKAAEHAAASNALQHLKTLGLLAPVPQPSWPPHQSAQLPGWLAQPQSLQAQKQLEFGAATGGATTFGAPTFLGAREPQDLDKGALRPVAGTSNADASGAAQSPDDALAKFLDKLTPADMKRLLVEAQQRITGLEAQLAKYSAWHRRIRELVLEDVS